MTTAINSTEAVLERLVAKEGIQQAFDNYALGMDLHDLDRFLSAWHPDATFIQDNPKGEFVGHQRLQEWVESVWSGYACTNHLVGNVSVEFKSSTLATSIGGCVGLLVQADGSYQPGGAHYFDRYELRDGVWRISYRKCWVSHLTLFPGANITRFPRDPASEASILS
jgi:hypothetical protein